MTESSSPATPLLTWSIHPAASRPGATVAAAAIIVLFSLAAAFGFGHYAWGLLSAGVLFISLNRFFLPSTFAIDESGITASYPLTRRRLEWKAVRRFEPGMHQITLSTSVRRTWLNASRELHVALATEKSAALELIRSRLPEDLVKPVKTEKRAADPGTAN